MQHLPEYAQQNWPKTRQFERFELETKLTVRTADAELRGWCADVGEGGLGGIIAARLFDRQEVAVEFELPSVREPLVVRAVVRYTNGFRYGFEFLSLTSEQREAIARYGKSAELMKTRAPSRTPFASNL